jgi:hypothetical protein
MTEFPVLNIVRFRDQIHMMAELNDTLAKVWISLEDYCLVFGRLYGEYIKIPIRQVAGLREFNLAEPFTYRSVEVHPSGSIEPGKGFWE